MYKLNSRNIYVRIASLLKSISNYIPNEQEESGIDEDAGKREHPCFLYMITEHQIRRIGIKIMLAREIRPVVFSDVVF